MIVGLTGKNAAGKGVVADYLVKAGFQAFSLSDMIREDLKSRGLAVTRENLIEAGQKLRREGGASVLADKLLDHLDSDKNYVVDSIRNPEEVRALRRRKDFILISVDADRKIRFERLKSRARPGDPEDFTTFVKLEEQELTNPDPAGQQLLATAALADVTLENNGSVAEFENRVRDVVLEALRRETRPDWDSYFIGIAQVASQRSNCIKRKVAAVIVRDHRVISTGYNGTPRGVKNCNEGGCPRCNDFAPSGAALGECLCSHAEENAIVQAAYHGASIKGATLYTTFSPCLICTKMILNSGIAEVVYNAPYPLGGEPLRLLQDAGVTVRSLRP